MEHFIRVVFFVYKKSLGFLCNPLPSSILCQDALVASFVYVITLDKFMSSQSSRRSLARARVQMAGWPMQATQRSCPRQDTERGKACLAWDDDVVNKNWNL